MADHELSETHYVRGYRDALTFVETALAAAPTVPPSRPLDRVRVVALAWIHQDGDGTEETAQQIKDGHTILRVLAGGPS